MGAAHIALVGDYSPEVVAHRAIPLALAEAGLALQTAVTWHWVGSHTLSAPEKDLAGYSGLWVVPASPYENMDGVLSAIGWARTMGLPFLGTCGGFQHALIEYARSVAGIGSADHAETEPNGSDLVVSALSCSLVGKTGQLRFAEGSRIASAYDAAAASEAYHCNYGLNGAFRGRLESAGLRFTAFDENGEVRAAEIPSHPFFVGTLFQPERAALSHQAAPLVRAFVAAAAR